MHYNLKMYWSCDNHDKQWSLIYCVISKLCVAYAAKLCDPLYDAILTNQNINEKTKIYYNHFNPC